MIRSVAYLAMHSCPLLQPGRGDAGGMNVYIHELATTMARRGIEVVVFTRLTGEHIPEEVVVEPGYRVVHVAVGPPVHLPVADLPPLAGGFGHEVASWSAVNRVGFDLVHSHYWVSGWAGVIVKEALRIPLANSFHTLGRVKDLRRRPDEPPSSAMRVQTERDVIAQSDCVISSTPYEFDDLLEHYGATPERLCVSPPGIDRSLFTPGDRTAARRHLGLGDEPIVLQVGRIQAHKGADIAIQALARMPEGVAAGAGPAQLVFVGGPSGPGGDEELASLRALAARVGVADRVHFVDPQPHQRLVHYYRAANVLVMPSRTETFGLVAAEAQACGLPVVASRVGGLPFVVRGSETGMLVDGFDPESFGAAITAVLDHPDFAARLGEGAVRRAEQFSWDATADRLLELYAGISAR